MMTGPLDVLMLVTVKVSFKINGPLMVVVYIPDGLDIMVNTLLVPTKMSPLTVKGPFMYVVTPAWAMVMVEAS